MARNLLNRFQFGLPIYIAISWGYWLVLINVAVAQTEPAKTQTPGVTCSDRQTSKACASFKQLLDAHDKDILELLAKKPTYVCFRPDEDAFVTFNIDAPRPQMWTVKTTHDHSQKLNSMP